MSEVSKPNMEEPQLPHVACQISGVKSQTQPLRHPPRPSHLASCLSPGFTLIELVVSVAVMSILFVAIGSTLVLASWAVPEKEPTGADKVLLATRIVGQITAELQYALSITEKTNSSIAFTVADRDGDAVPESIRYVWSGTAGTSLIRAYNGGSPVDLAPDVYEFDLRSLSGASRTRRRLLLVVPAGGLGSQDYLKKMKMESWGYQVTPISATESQADFDEAVSQHDVAYISETVFSSDLDDKLTNARIGVVNEEVFLDDSLKLSKSKGATYRNRNINLTDNSHHITATFRTGRFKITNSYENLGRHRPTLTPGGQVLAYQVADSGGAVFMVVEMGGELADGSRSAGRRVALPWGGSSFDFTNLTGNGYSLLKRSLDWAAASFALTHVQISLRIGSDMANRMETQAHLLNAPEVTVP